MVAKKQKQATDLKAVMGKIAKLRELAERGGTVAEAEVASAKMAELLLRHNLSMQDITDYATETGRKVVDDTFDFRANSWRQSLLFTVAEAHLSAAVRIKGFTPRSHHCRMVVVGHEHNLIVVRETWEFLQKEVIRLGNAMVKVAAAAGDEMAVRKPGTWLRDFQLGAVMGIDASYAEMRGRVRAEVGDQWAIVPVIEGEVTRYFEELFPETTNRAQIAKVGVDAFEAGQKAGRGINLDRQLGGTETSAAIGA